MIVLRQIKIKDVVAEPYKLSIIFEYMDSDLSNLLKKLP